MTKINYHLRQEKTVSGLLFRDYIARLDDMTPVDSFTVFYSNGQWTAWTGDTINSRLKNNRMKFAGNLNDQSPA